MGAIELGPYIVVHCCMYIVLFSERNAASAEEETLALLGSDFKGKLQPSISASSMSRLIHNQSCFHFVSNVIECPFLSINDTLHNNQGIIKFLVKFS